MAGGEIGTCDEAEKGCLDPLPLVPSRERG